MVDTSQLYREPSPSEHTHHTVATACQAHLALHAVWFRAKLQIVREFSLAYCQNISPRVSNFTIMTINSDFPCNFDSIW